ncbi:MAG: hypothetical protein H6607_08635 [Flavobacteriales bacterium]|nr:hypothetical protein [Flavobacteriales bacterium]
MRRFFYSFIIASLSILSLNGCVEDDFYVYDPPQAVVQYDFWAGARTVEVDGDIINDGNTFISSAEIEIMLYDEYGYYISSVFQTFNVNLYPRDRFSFSTDIQERGVYDVDVRLQALWD